MFALLAQLGRALDLSVMWSHVQVVEGALNLNYMNKILNGFNDGYNPSFGVGGEDPIWFESIIDKNFDPKMIHLKGKRVEITFNGSKIVGILKFAGINSLHNQYQVTINRMPCWPIDPKLIKEVNDKI